MVPSGCILSLSAGRTKMKDAQAKTLRNRIAEFSKQFETCTTEAQRRCVKQSILAAERQLTEGGAL